PTIGRDLHAATIALRWVTGAYAVVFGGLMLVFGAIADRFGRRRIMLIGLVLLGIASLAAAGVHRAEPQEVGGVGHRAARAADRDGFVFEGLFQDFEDILKKPLENRFR